MASRTTRSRSLRPWRSSSGGLSERLPSIVFAPRPIVRNAHDDRRQSSPNDSVRSRMKALAAAAWTTWVLAFALGGCRSQKNDRAAEQASTFDRKPESSPAAVEADSADFEPKDSEAEQAMPRGAD